MDNNSQADKKSAGVLIVEDDPLIAMDMEMSLERLGHDVLGTATGVAEGLSILENTVPEFAILDYNLGNETSTPVAIELSKRNIEFIYVTGNRRKVLADEHAPDAPIISKPIDTKEIVAAYFG